MGTTISGATGIDKVQDGTIVNADINSSAAIAESKLATIGGTIKSIKNVRLSSTTTISGTTSGHSAWTEIGNGTVTPVSSSSIFLIDWQIGFAVNNERVGADWSLFINGSQTADAVGGNALSGTQYFSHRVTTNGSGYYAQSGTWRYNAVSTSSVNIGIGIRAYDENIGYNISCASNAMPARLIIMEFVL